MPQEHREQQERGEQQDTAPESAVGVGVFGIGLEAYWAQFPGLRERLEGWQAHVEQRLGALGARVVSAGLVDTAPRARAAAAILGDPGLDLLVCYVGTYATSSQVLPAVQFAAKPVVILNLQPAAALDYAHCDTAEWLAHCCACCVPEIANAFARARVRFNVVTGMLFDDAIAWGEIADWVAAARAARALRRARIGYLGHPYPGMLDMYTDFTEVSARLGTHLEILEMDDLHRAVARVGEPEVAAKQAEIRARFTLARSDGPGADPIARPIPPETMAWAARVACALDRLVAEHDLQGLTYYYRGLDGNENERLWSALIVGNTLLTARGVPAAGEADLKTCLAMLLCDRLGAGGSFTEFYAMDFRESFVLMGHDGPGHIAIAAEPPVLRGLGVYHGKRGAGVAVEFRVRIGPVSILGLTQTEAGLKLVLAEGEAIPGPTLAIGNTNSRLRFALPPREFLTRWCEQAPTHHVALAIGHQRARVEKLARILGLDLAVV